MTTKFNLKDCSAVHEYRVENFGYKVQVPNTDRMIHYTLILQRDDEGEYSESSIEVSAHDILHIVGYALFGKAGFKYQDELLNIISHSWELDDWGHDEFDFYTSLSEDNFFDLIPDGVKELGVGVGANGEYCWGGIEIKWDEIDWFGDDYDDPGQRCLAYVEDLLNTAIEVCANEWDRRHKE